MPLSGFLPGGYHWGSELSSTMEWAFASRLGSWRHLVDPIVGDTFR